MTSSSHIFLLGDMGRTTRESNRKSRQREQQMNTELVKLLNEKWDLCSFFHYLQNICSVVWHQKNHKKGRKVTPIPLSNKHQIKELKISPNQGWPKPFIKWSYFTKIWWKSKELGLILGGSYEVFENIWRQKTRERLCTGMHHIRSSFISEIIQKNYTHKNKE